MKITVLGIGKLKEKYLQEGVAEYLKRLTPFAKIEVVELPEERMPQDPSEAQKKQALQKETQRILAAVPGMVKGI